MVAIEDTREAVKVSTAAHELPRTRRSPAELAAALRESYTTTLRLVGGFDDRQWLGPYLPIVNPPLWEVGHVAWFLERWVLRRPTGDRSFVDGADALYDSSRITHVARWFLPLPDPQATLAYLARVTNGTLQQLESGCLRAAGELYYVELSLYHQDMHNEAFRYTRQTLAQADPLAAPLDPAQTTSGSGGDRRIPAGTVSLGAGPQDGFVFDNEKWAHPVTVPAFAIAADTVSNGEYLAFVEEGGYGRREWWTEAGWAWRAARALRGPTYWRRRNGRWQQRRFDVWHELDPALPVIHVSAHEAEAWCCWAGRRLPSEAEWQRAAASTITEGERHPYPWGDALPDRERANLDGGGLLPVGALPRGDSAWGLRQMLGNVWEWTASPFEPFPGFSADPYADYSRPWFGSHRVLRGGSFATAARLARSGYRNFYTPDRADVFCGFRSCALT